MIRSLPALLTCLWLAACGADAGQAAARRLADREAIEATMQRYLQGLDRLDADLYASSFAPDAVLDIDGNARTGREAMRAVIGDEIALRRAMQERGETPRVLFHMESNVQLSFPDPDNALRAAYWTTFIRVGQDPEGLSALGVGTSTDELRRIDGQWLIVRRHISLQP